MNHRAFFRHEHPIAMAHRGGAGLWPENTMAAFRGAVEMGYRYIETDLRATRDGVLVAFHDPVLDRTTDATGPVAERSWEELAGVDAAHRFGSEEGFPWRGEGQGIPRLDRVVRELPDTYFTLELKVDGIEGLLAGLIAEHDLWDRVLVGSFSDRRLRRVRRSTGGRVPTSAGQTESTWVWMASRVGLPLPTKADALQLPVVHRGREVVDGKLVWAAHAAGKQVHVWTVDERGEMERLLDLGVDGILTDRPDVLTEVLAGRSGG